MHPGERRLRSIQKVGRSCRCRAGNHGGVDVGDAFDGVMTPVLVQDWRAFVIR